VSAGAPFSLLPQHLHRPIEPLLASWSNSVSCGKLVPTAGLVASRGYDLISRGVTLELLDIGSRMVAIEVRRPSMITAVVQIPLPKPVSSEEAARAFELTAPNYQGLRGLVRKYYLRSEDGRRVGGVYLWETRAAAEAVYSIDWMARVQKLYGAEPEISWFETPVIVDNNAGGTISKAPGRNAAATA
jgi:hypothetical protein